MNPKQLSRRDFLAASAQAAGALGAGAMFAGCAHHKPGSTCAGGKTKHNFRLGLDTYMMHHSLTAQDPRHRLDLYTLIDRLDEVGLTGLQVDPSHYKLIPGDEPAAIDRLASIRKDTGYYFEIGMGGWDPTRMIQRIKMTARLGGKALRTFCGSENNTQEEIKNYIQWAAPALREAAEKTEDCNVKIAVENHGDFTSDQLLELIQLANHPRVGACLDTGNSLFRKECPLKCAKNLAPYAYSMHLKDWFMTHDAEGKPHWKGAILGQGEVPVAEILRIVARHNPGVYIALENPAPPGDDEAQTVQREWDHLLKNTAAARDILANL